jgi:hypothetical protein
MNINHRCGTLDVDYYNINLNTYLTKGMSRMHHHIQYFQRFQYLHISAHGFSPIMRHTS